MSRPIYWALGVLATSICFGNGAATRIASALHAAPPREEAALATDPDGAPIVTLQQDWSGHYTVHPMVDGHRTRMMVDTGATLCAFTFEDAERAGLRLTERDFTKPMSTANGVVRGAQVRIAEMQVGGITLHGVEAVVLPRGRLDISLLGMSFLRRLRSFESAAGRLTLKG
ncbi:retropepsin-like aspartic protease family protein [Methylobacterium sp. JK268]